MIVTHMVDTDKTREAQIPHFYRYVTKNNGNHLHKVVS